MDFVNMEGIVAKAQGSDECKSIDRAENPPNCWKLAPSCLFHQYDDDMARSHEGFNGSFWGADIDQKMPTARPAWLHLMGFMHDDWC
jgi:hypothetical protein